MAHAEISEDEAKNDVASYFLFNVLDYENKREEMLGHLTNDNRNHDVYIARYNAGKFVESIEKLM